MVIDKIIAASVGCGIAADRDDYNIIIDIGGSQSEIALICKGSCELSNKIKIGGDTLDDEMCIRDRSGNDVRFRM